MGEGQNVDQATEPSGGQLLFHFYAESFAHTLEDNFHGLNNPYFWICLAIYNHLVFGFFSLCYVHVMLMCEPVVPTAVPSGEPVSVTLPRVGELGAGQSLNVEKSLSIRISTEVDLSFSV